jgi:hypothetical protein
VHLRRALLLFAIVLGLAAVVASVSRPDRASRTGGSEREPAPGPRPSVPARSSEPVRLSAEQRKAIRRLAVGRPAVVSVSSPRSGLVSIPALGLTRAAEPGTPARFDVFETRPGRFPVVFSPAGGEGQRRIGTLVLRR